MEKANIVYQNKWCKIINKGTYYILRSKAGKYNDQYFLTFTDALKSIGVDALRFLQK